MHEFPLQVALNKEGPAWGSWLTLPSTAVARSLASTPGMSWVCIDAEHGLISDMHMYDLVNAVASSGCSPIIRIPVDEVWWVKRALDAGAHGVVVPMGSDAEFVKRMVSAAKYPPQGVRGFGPMFTHGAGAIGRAYSGAANNQIKVIVQIETLQGVENVETIAAVDGLDVMFIGPNDLAFSLGVAPGSDEHEAAIAKILAAGKKAGTAVAIFCADGKQSAKRREQGFDMISIGVDIDSLVAAYEEHMAHARGSASIEGGSGGGSYS